MRGANLLVLLAALFASSAARAQPTPDDRLAAETLFNEGRAFLGQKKYDEACPKFAASQRLDPAVGTLLNLADCYEQKGQMASAWLAYREAASLAQQRNDERRATVGRGKAAALEPKLARVVIRAPSGVEVTRDGARVEPALLGSAVPVDAGSHAVEARATGKKTWKTTVRVSDAGVAAVEVPELEADTGANPEAASLVVVSPKVGTGERERSSGGVQRVAGLVVAGAGVVAIGVGTAFALDAKSKWSSVTDRCPDGHCADEATRAAQAGAKDDASKSAAIATTGFVAGGVLLVGGALLFFTAPHSARAEARVRVTPAVAPGVAGISLDGAFQ